MRTNRIYASSLKALAIAFACAFPVMDTSAAPSVRMIGGGTANVGSATGGVRATGTATKPAISVSGGGIARGATIRVPSNAARLATSSARPIGGGNISMDTRPGISISRPTTPDGGNQGGGGTAPGGGNIDLSKYALVEELEAAIADYKMITALLQAEKQGLLEEGVGIKIEDNVVSVAMIGADGIIVDGDTISLDADVLASINGIKGEDGRTVELRKVPGGPVQWKYTDEVAWRDLIDMNEIRGADGVDGIDGMDGLDGADGMNGESVEIQVADGYIQWRNVGDMGVSEWINLINLEDLRGESGIMEEVDPETWATDYELEAGNGDYMMGVTMVNGQKVRKWLKVVDEFGN